MGDRVQMEMSHEHAGHKPTKLRTLFLKYLAVFCAGTIGLVLILALVLIGCMGTGIIFPANYAEKQVLEAESRILEGVDPLDDTSDALYKYAKFTFDGKLLDHSLSARQSATAWELLEDTHASYRFPYYYRKVTHGQDVYIFQFSVSAKFSNPVLRSILPNAELFFLGLFCFIFLGGSALLASSFGRKIARKMSKLQETVQHIQEQNLDFSIQYSGIVEIDRVLQSMDQMKSALSQSLERQWSLERSRRDQISALAHDIKTPLTIVRGNVELLSETHLTEEQKGYSDYIAASTRQMESYINTLIEITKTEGSTSLHPVIVNTEEFIRKIKGQMQALAVIKELSPEVTTRELPDTLYADPALLERALLNVISNGVDQAPVGSKLTMIVESVQDRIRFTVIDEGPGFSPEALKLATEQFYMGDASRGTSGHYGMGLYITKFIARLHRGEVQIANSALTGGGEVTVEIPLRQERGEYFEALCHP